MFHFFYLFILILYGLFLLLQILKVFHVRVFNKLCVATSFLLTSGCEYIPHTSWKHEAQYLLTTACYVSHDETNNVHSFVDNIYYLNTPTRFGLQGHLREHHYTYINYFEQNESTAHRFSFFHQNPNHHSCSPLVTSPHYT
jgi:hypothetical protein